MPHASCLKYIKALPKSAVPFYGVYCDIKSCWYYSNNVCRKTVLFDIELEVPLNVLLKSKYPAKRSLI